jgi:transposase
MAQNFIGCDRDQVLLLPPDLGEWLPAGHLARFVIETVGVLDLEAIYAYYRQDGRGRPAHDPAMMVALVLYAYAVGVTSSRAIERRCVEDVAFRFITANQAPDHATVARFLIRHRAAIAELFDGVLVLCARAGMVRVGTIAVDSTKLAANASADQNRTYEGLRELAERVIEEAIETDRREDELYGEKRGDELPEELADPRTRRAKIRELLEQAQAEREALEAERAVMHEREAQREQTPRGQRKPGRPPLAMPPSQKALWAKKYNLTDPDSQIVRHRGMLMQGYGIQTAVNERQIILSARAGGGIDQGQLSSVIADARRALDRVGIDQPIIEVLADSGYWSTRQIRDLQDQRVRVLIPPRKTDTNATAKQLRQTLDSEDGASAYKRRQQLIEPVFAHWKHIRGITRLWRRGRQAVQAEIDLIATTHNLLKLYRTLPTAT